MNHYLEVADLVRLSGVAQTTINALVTNAVIDPAVKGGVGRGCGHKFNLQQAVAIVYGAQWQTAGYAPIVKHTTQYIANLSRKKLEDQIERGYTFLMMLPETDEGGVIQGWEPFWFDLKTMQVNNGRDAKWRAWAKGFNIETVYNRVLHRLMDKYPELVEDREEEPVVNRTRHLVVNSRRPRKRRS